MIQDIEPKKYDPAFKRRRPKDEDILLHYEYNKVMLREKAVVSLLLKT